jgi:hypothetical protein
MIAYFWKANLCLLTLIGQLLYFSTSQGYNALDHCIVSLDSVKFDDPTVVKYSKFFLQLDNDLQPTPFTVPLIDDMVIAKSGAAGDDISLKTDSTLSSFFSKMEIIGDNGLPLIPTKNYFINYHSVDQLYTNFNLHNTPYDESSKDDLKSIIQSHMGGWEFRNNTYKNENKKILKTAKLENYDFALVEDKIQLIFTFSNSDKLEYASLSEHDIELDLIPIYDLQMNKVSNNIKINEIRVKDFWTMQDPITGNNMLALMDNDLQFYLFNVTSTSIKFYSQFSFKNQVATMSTDPNFLVSQVGLWDKYFIIGGEYYLAFLAIDHSKMFNTFIVQPGLLIGNFQNKKGDMHNMLVKDFIVNQNSLYIIIKDYGLKIFDLKQMKLLPWQFEHHCLKNIDRTYDPETGLSYAGITIDNKERDMPEFFMELSMLDELNPRINKIYTSSVSKMLTNVVSINDYSYFVDNYMGCLCIVKRNLNHDSPGMLFLIMLPDILSLSEVYNIFHFNNRGLPGLFFTSTSYINYSSNLILWGFKPPVSTMTIQFKDTGRYNVKCTYFKSVLCNENMMDMHMGRHLQTSPFKSVKIVHVFTVKVYDKLVYVWAIIGLVLGCLLLLTVIYIIFRTTRKSKTIKTQPVNPIDKKEIVYSQAQVAPVEKDGYVQNAESQGSEKQDKELIIIVDNKL